MVAALPPTGESIDGAIPFSAHTKAVLRGALDEALDLNHNYIGTEHLLLALQRDETYQAARILAELGADRDRLRETLKAEIDRLAQARAKRATTAE